MSASTGTIQRPMAGGSVLGAVALGAVALVATLGLAWGLLNLTATMPAATPVAVPAYLDHGGRNDALPVNPAAYTPVRVKPFVGDSIVSKPEARPFVGDSIVSKPEAKPFVGDSIVSKPDVIARPDVTIPRQLHTTHPRHLGPR